MTIARKIFAGFGVVLVILLIFAAISSYQLDQTKNAYQKMLDNRMKQKDLASDVQLAMASAGQYVRSFVLQQIDSDLPIIAEHQEKFQQSLDELESYVQAEEMKQLLDQANSNRVLFNDSVELVIAAVQSGDEERADRLLREELRPANEAIQEAGNKMIAYQDKMIASDRAAVEKQVRNDKAILWTTAIISLILGAIISWIVSRMISKPLGTIQEAAAAISEGDLMIPDIEVKTKDELRNLSNSFNQMKAHLRQLIGGVHDNALHVTASAEQLSASMDELTKSAQEVTHHMENISLGASKSAASAKESSVAMEETANSLQQIVEATQSLEESSSSTKDLAGSSEQSVATARNQMNVIYDSSRQASELVQRLTKQSVEIETITNVITDITEQTNLLALNAAIEAARAGEHGKGFAVVADEVRKLAEQSKASANQIVALTLEIQNDTKDVERAVSESMKNVEAGVTTIDETGMAFTKIFNAFQQMSGQIGEISAATEEISASAEEVSASIQDMALQSSRSHEQTDETTGAIEEQMATVEEVNSVAQDLSRQAMDLQNMIQQFKI